MRARLLTAGAVLVVLVAVAARVLVLTRPDFAVPSGVKGHQPELLSASAPIAWTATGAFLLWARPRNRVGALVLFVGVCQALAQVSEVYAMYGVGVARPQWPGAAWVGLIGAPLWVPGFLPLASVLLAIYPEGRLPGPHWRLPVLSACVGIGLVTIAMAGGYSDVAPGDPPIRVDLPMPLKVALVSTMALTTIGGVLAIWIMSVVRLARAQPPERAQLAWLLFTVVPLFLLTTAIHFPLYAVALPLAVAVGVLRYRMLGIEVVLRRGLVYLVLTAVVITAYLVVTAVTVAAGSSLEHGPLPGVVAGALAAVGITPLRERLQRGVDRLLYGDRRDPMRAVARLADSVSTASASTDLLSSVLQTVMNAVRAPGAAVTVAGRALRQVGEGGSGLDLPLRVGGTDVGTLSVVARRPGEGYTDGDVKLLSALAPQVGVVVLALDLAEALEAERDRVVLATRAERDRLRRDLHDGIGPSLSGVSLGLQALETAVLTADTATARDLIHRVRTEADLSVLEVRRILDDLRPAALDEAGLVSAVRRYAQAVTPGVPVELEVSAELPPIPAAVETAAYRIAQEALTNVVRHAGAGRARLRLGIDAGALRVEITDDGNGFLGEGPAGVGLHSMHHRVEALGGTLNIISAPDGTSVVATLPLGQS